MRVAAIQTNQTCDQRCCFCNARRSVEQRQIAGPESIRQRIDQALAAGATTLVLTGGEPTLRRDLPAIVSYVKRASGVTVVLETNGGSTTPESAIALAAAGLDTARVHLPCWGEAADRLTGVAGSFRAAERALTAFAAAGVAIELSLPIVAGNRTSAAALAAAAAASGLPIERLWLVVPLIAPDPTTLLPIGEATAVVEAVAAAAAEVGLPASLATAEFVPPCAFAHPERVAHLFAMTPGGAARSGYQRLPGCKSCQVADRCPGLAEPLRASGFDVAPLTSDRLRRRLSNIATVDQQIERELVTDELYRRDDGSVQPAATVRVNFRCNQRCHFCFVSTHLPDPPPAAVDRAISAIAAGGGVLVISGGEPTLNPDLLELVARGRAGGARSIELQTNGVLLAAPGRAAALAAAGVTDALVSLHGSTAEIADAVTEAPGSFDRTLAGIDQLVAAAIHTRLNFVFCQRNRGDFAAYVDLVARRWPQVSLTVSFIASSTDLVPASPEVIPRYRDILADLAAGLSLARATGLEVTGFDSMCGVPLCLVPKGLGDFFQLAPIPAGFDRGEFLRGPQCRGCGLAERCFGLRRGYAELYGFDELVGVGSSGE